ncbi:cyclic lactone autoinducer peptide [Fonticella tunisiensis]|uniref:Cyclic lactone autoinducer peptide n=1 Tax=Fonticella tunisiensis TaxID=1096341 RepID=A0A4V3ETE2_9CLOT|nr:cyclic lactone autoinducer peptide [Fonticella tunisiensis]TDT61297.1 cyclic lactone autoinducer peptide [Fonticella tunisiensis]
MGKRFTKLMVTLGAGLFTLFALSTSASACVFGYYQPEEPKALREE